MRENVIGFALSAMLFALSVSIQAQEATKIPRIGFLIGSSPSANAARIEAFRQGLRELDTLRGKTLSLNSGRRKENLIGCLTLRPK
jgi:putative ABC transport system substrate-binding protein